jgi:hypothetical protein
MPYKPSSVDTQHGTQTQAKIIQGKFPVHSHLVFLDSHHLGVWLAMLLLHFVGFGGSKFELLNFTVLRTSAVGSSYA